MGMSTGGSKGGPAADINMTPMIDVLLVLLIIFMVVQQSLQKGVSVQVPPVKKQEQQQVQQNQQSDQIVLEVKAGRQFFVNTQPVPEAQLHQFLYDTYLPRPRKVLFVKADEDVAYGDVVYAVDTARSALAAGAEGSLDNVVVGLVPRPTPTAVPGV